MAGGGYDDDDDGGGFISGINVTPLVDITLVLLIIFMVTARFIVNRAIPAKLPRTASGEEVKTTLGLTLDAQRALFMNGERMTDRQVVAEYVRKAVAANPDLQAVIAADESVPHGEVMALIDLVKVAGVKNFGLATEEKPKPH